MTNIILYLKNFITFWRHFIVGDDLQIAIIAFWSVFFVGSLASNYYNPWILLPIAMFLLMGWMVYKETTTRTKVLYSRKFIYSIQVVVPAIIVSSFSAIIFRYSSGDLAEHINSVFVRILIFMLLGIVLYRTWLKYPVFVTGIFMALAYMWIRYWY